MNFYAFAPLIRGVRTCSILRPRAGRPQLCFSPCWILVIPLRATEQRAQMAFPSDSNRTPWLASTKEAGKPNSYAFVRSSLNSGKYGKILLLVNSDTSKHFILGLTQYRLSKYALSALQPHSRSPEWPFSTPTRTVFLTRSFPLFTYQMSSHEHHLRHV